MKRYAIFLTDRRKLGGAIRCLPKPYLDQKTTEKLPRSITFDTKREARKYLSGIEPDPHYVYTVVDLAPLMPRKASKSLHVIN